MFLPSASDIPTFSVPSPPIAKTSLLPSGESRGENARHPYVRRTSFLSSMS